MLPVQHRLFLRRSLVVVWHFVLLVTETSSLKPEEKHPSQPTEAVRLVQGPSRCSGMLEVKFGQSWAPVCESSFSSETALVTCRDLECGFPDIYMGRHSRPYENTRPVFKCDGKEKHLMDCPTTTLNITEEELSQCYNTHLTCTERPVQPYISLYFKWAPHESTEVFKGHRFAVFCKNVSPYKALSIRLKTGVYTQHPSEHIQSPVDNEAVFMFPAAEDAHQGTYQCDYNFDFSPEVFSKPSTTLVTVKEHNDVRLVNGGSRCAGRLEVEYQKEWRPVSSRHSWSLKEAAVLCRQLNCGSALETSKVQNAAELLPVWRFYSACDGSEQALMDCGTVKTWLSSSTVEVVCSDILFRPNITLPFMRGKSDDHNVMLFKGHSFTIRCSVEPQYPGGHFSIIFTGLKRTHSHSHTQPAVNHSANFTYASADKSLQGNYSCVYHNFVFNHNFSAESHRLSLTLFEVEDVMLDDGVLRDDDSVPCAGKLIVYLDDKLKLLSAESTVWDLRHASVVCRQLGCGSAVSTKHIDLPQKEYMWQFFSDCDGSESALLDCGSVELWFSSSAIEVVCTGSQELRT